MHTPKRGERHGLLIKERDAYVDERGTDGLPDDSIYSGLLVDQLAHPKAREAEIVGRAREFGAPPGAEKEAPVGKGLPKFLPASSHRRAFGAPQ